MSYKSIFDFGRERMSNYSVHANVVNRFSRECDITLDKSCDCGTTVIVYHNLYTNFILFEKDLKYYKIAVDRFKQSLKTNRV